MYPSNFYQKTFDHEVYIEEVKTLASVHGLFDIYPFSNSFIEELVCYELMAFDAKKFFWWRAFKEVGTGVAGDLFIHLLSGSHFITNSKGPESIYSTGWFSYWKDGRNLPDVMSGVMQYPDSPEHPAFQMTLQVNFISGTGGQEVIQLVGSEGVIQVQGNNITLKHSLMPEAPGFGGYDSLFTFSESMQDEMTKEYNAKWTPEQRKDQLKKILFLKLLQGTMTISTTLQISLIRYEQVNQ